MTKGARAPQAAGVIHTDFEKGFIRAETIAYDDYVTHHGEAGARDAGSMRLEGKEYIVARRRRDAFPVWGVIHTVHESVAYATSLNPATTK